MVRQTVMQNHTIDVFSRNMISNKEYPEVEGCSQTVPVWLSRSGCAAWSGTTDVWLLHDGILIAGNHLTFIQTAKKFIDIIQNNLKENQIN